MKRISRIAAGLPDSSVLDSIVQTNAILDRYHQMEERNRRLFTVLQDSSVLRSVYQMEERNRRLFTVLQENARRMEERNRRLFTVLQENARRMEERNRRLFTVLQENARRMEERNRRLFTVLQENARRMEERDRRLFAVLQENARKVEAVVDSARLTAMALQESPAMRAIREFSNTPFNPVVKEIVFNDLDSLEIEQSDISEYPDLDTDQSIQSEIRKELAESRDYNRLSEKAKSVLLYIYHRYLLPILLFYLAPIIVTNIQKVVTDLEESKTLAEVRAYVRKPTYGINKVLLKDYRVVTGSDVRLRKKPSMKSEIITKLPRGKLIEVLDKSKRSWLHVEVDIEGEIFIGWVSRRYTTYFK